MPIIWFNSCLDANIDSYKSLNFVGVPNAFAFMLLVWIVIFTMNHEEAVESLGKVVSDAVMEAVAGEPAGEQTGSVPPVGVEDEF